MSFLLALLLLPVLASARPLTVGSKKFTESVILGEVLRLGLKSEGKSVRHQRELGGTTLLWNALLSGDVDLYPEYTGTIQEEIFKGKIKDPQRMRKKLRELGIGMSASLGFNNTYAVGMRRERAKELGIRSISDLHRHQNLVMAWANEFMERKDGWPGLQEAYGLTHTNVRGIDHDVAYRALVKGDVDVIDLYSTDAEIPYYDIEVLADDKIFFPTYDAVILYRLNRAEGLKGFIGKLEGKISAARMSALNKEVKIDKLTSTQVAASFLKDQLGVDVEFKKVGRKERILERSLEHLKLVSISLLLAILFAIPLGIVAAKFSAAGKVIIMIVSAIQTIPALALLVMMIKPLGLLGLSGIGDTPALIALFLYSLLPIVRNTHAGICQIPMNLQETALVLNLSKKTRLLRIELPLALPMILTGIKTSLVLNIGFATLGALVGAGGYGQSILTGIRLDNYGLILEGALPAAILALLAQQLFDSLEKALVSRGLRV